MKRQGRSTDQALLRTAVNKKVQTFAHKRLMKDLLQIQNQTIPTVGVVARPLDTDLFTWHGNLRGPADTLYDGGIFHIQLKFPLSYPNHPPTVTLFTPIPHPNVFDNYICLDMIQTYGDVRKEEGAGWTSAYTVQSVLTQLQSFLFEENLNKDRKEVEMEAKKAVKNANDFKCHTCKHGGKLSAYPPFSVKEQTISEFSTLDDQNQLIRKELICFHTKVSYKQNQLGLGLNISKIPRTGNIREGETFFDYISIKAFLKQSMKLTSHNERITHWLPVYLGKQDNQQKFLFFLRQSLSMIMTNSTKNFCPQFITQVFPKLMITTIFYIMDQKKHASIRAIRILTHLHSMFLLCLKKYPQLKVKLNEELNSFLEKDENRHKNVLSNLGSILAKLSALDQFMFQKVAETYFKEQLDRQVLWILKAVPELLNQDMEQEGDKHRIEMVFKTQTTSFHMFCFYKVFITQICQKRKTRQHMLQEYQYNLCKLSNKEQDQFQRMVMEIPKKVTSFNEFFKFIGLKQRDQEQTLKMLKDAIKNSERKKYHGEFEIMYELPQTGEQLKNVLSKVPSYSKYIKVTSEKKVQGEKQIQTFKIDEEVSTDENWKKMCIQRWAWIRQALSYDQTLDSKHISNKALKYSREGISKPQDRLSKIIRQNYLSSKVNYQQPCIQLPTTSWKTLFLRLDMQEFLSHINMNPDFPVFYQKLQVCKHCQVNTILISLIETNNIKSGYYYLTSLLSKLTTLKYVEFTGVPQIVVTLLNEKAEKAIKKGFANFKKAGGKLEIISFHNFYTNKDVSDGLFQYFVDADSIKSLRFIKTNIFGYGNTMKILANHLVNLKNVEQLVFDNCVLNQDRCKILADSLMRMKNLKIFQIHDIYNLGLGLASIIYNLAFSPNLIKLDISKCAIVNNNQIPQTVTSLQKILKINSSIQIIKATNIYNLNTALTKQYWASLGECRTLRVLDLAYSGSLNDKVNMMGKAVAFNAKKNCHLKYLNLTSCLSGSQSIESFYVNMNVSEYDQEQLYGDPNRLSKMIPSNFKKQYFNNLIALQVDNCQSLNPNFNLVHYNKLNQKTPPAYVKLFSQSPCLQSLNLRQTSMLRNIADILVLALDNRNVNVVSKIKVLDLSKNNLGKQGLKVLAEVLPHNHCLQVLDLSKNQLGVSGACQLSHALKGNKTLKYLNIFNNKISYDGAKAIAENIVANSPSLQFLEIGHNRIRDKGLKAIIDAIISNKNSALKILCFRFNFVTNSSAQYMLKQISTSSSKLQQIFMRNNMIDDMCLSTLSLLQQKCAKKISIDILQKIKFLQQNKSDRTVWINPITSINLQSLKKFFQITYKCGIVMDLRIRKGKTYPNKKQQNLFGFVQFADQTSVTRALHLAASKKTTVDGVKFRIYKAGTGTFLYTKKTAKQRKLEVAKNSLPPVPYAIEAAINGKRGAQPMRGGRAGRGRAFPLKRVN